MLEYNIVMVAEKWATIQEILDLISHIGAYIRIFLAFEIVSINPIKYWIWT